MTKDAKAWCPSSGTMNIKGTLFGKTGVFSEGYDVSSLG